MKKKKARKTKVVRKKKTTKKRKASRRGAVKKKPVVPPSAVDLYGEPIGKVTHYFPKVRASAVAIERDEVRVGDTLYFKGHTTDFKQKVESMQIEHKPVSQASPGDEIGLRVKARTREHDQVFKL